MDDTPGHCPRLEKLQEGDDPDLVFTRLGDSGGRIIARGFGRFDNHDGFRPVKRSHRLKDERGQAQDEADRRSEEHTSELQSLMRISYAVFCLKKKTTQQQHTINTYKQTKTYTTTHN